MDYPAPLPARPLQVLAEQRPRVKGQFVRLAKEGEGGGQETSTAAISADPKRKALEVGCWSGGLPGRFLVPRCCGLRGLWRARDEPSHHSIAYPAN